MSSFDVDDRAADMRLTSLDARQAAARYATAGGGGGGNPGYQPLVSHYVNHHQQHQYVSPCHWTSQCDFR